MDIVAAGCELCACHPSGIKDCQANDLESSIAGCVNVPRDIAFADSCVLRLTSLDIRHCTLSLAGEKTKSKTTVTTTKSPKAKDTARTKDTAKDTKTTASQSPSL